MLVPGGFSYLKKQNNHNSNWKKLLGLRNMQEKLENLLFCATPVKKTSVEHCRKIMMITPNKFHHGLWTPNEGINQRYPKNWADVADKICFGRT